MTTKDTNVRSRLKGAAAYRLWAIRDENEKIPSWILRVIDDDLANRMVIRRGSLRISLSIASDRPTLVVDYVRGVRYDNLAHAASVTRTRSVLFVEQSIVFFSTWTRGRVAREYWSLTVSSRNRLLQDAPVEGGFQLWDNVPAALPSKEGLALVRDGRIDPIIHHPAFEQYHSPIFGSH